MNEDLLKALNAVQETLTSSSIKKVSSVSGGCIHQAWMLTLGNDKKIFAKTSGLESWQMLCAESKALQALSLWSNANFLDIPKPLALERYDKHSILLLPWKELNSGNQTNLGRGLALLHQKSSRKNLGKFGWDSDGFIGSGPQPGGWKISWGECFVELRLKPQLRIARKWGLKSELLESTLSSIVEFLNCHNPEPSLVHGDLWSGNAFVANDARGVLLDPASWWADREVDIAMTKLFGGFSKEFYSSYESIWPLSNSAHKRVNIYNLYHLLNHANLFGGAYKTQCEFQLKTLQKEMS